MSDERAAAAKLAKAGIDVDGLLAQRQAIAEKHCAAANAVNPALDGNLIQHLVLTMAHLQWGGGFREKPDVTADAIWRLCWEGLGPRSSR